MSTQTSLLLLDDDRRSAELLRSLFLAARADLALTSHQSELGLLPAAGEFHHIVLAEHYAHGSAGQLIEFCKLKYPAASLTMISEGGGATGSGKRAFEASRAGLDFYLLRNELSIEVLRNLLDQSAELAHPAAPLSSEPETAAASFTLETNEHKHASQERSAAATALPASRTQQNVSGEMLIERSKSGFIYRAISEQACQLEGLSAEQINQAVVKGEPHYENFDLLDALYTTVRAAARQRYKAMGIAANGEPQWRSYVLQMSGENQVQVMVSDISADMEQEFRQRQEQTIWQNIVQSHPDYAALLDEKGVISKLVSSNWASIHREPSTLPGQELSALLQADDLDSVLGLFHQTLNTGQTQSCIVQTDLPPINPVLDLRFSLLRQEANAPRHVLVVGRDIGQHQSKQEGATNPREYWEKISATTPFAIAIQDSQGRYEHANELFLGLANTNIDSSNIENAAGRYEEDLFDASIAQQLNALQQQLQQGQRLAETVLSFVTPAELKLRAIKLPLLEHSQHIGTCTLLLPLAEARAAARSKPDKKKSKPKLV